MIKHFTRKCVPSPKAQYLHLSCPQSIILVKYCLHRSLQGTTDKSLYINHRQLLMIQYFTHRFRQALTITHSSTPCTTAKFSCIRLCYVSVPPGPVVSPSQLAWILPGYMHPLLHLIIIPSPSCPPNPGPLLNALLATRILMI